MTPLSRRLGVAIWGIPLLLGAAYLGGWYFRTLIALLALGAAMETYRLVYSGPRRAVAWAPWLLALVAPFLLYAGLPMRLALLFVATLLAIGAAALTLDPEKEARAATAALLLPVYPILPLLHLLWLREWFGWPAVFFLFGLLWLGDTAAYAGGCLTGKHLLAPRISPKKTIEGAAWALIVSLAAALGAYLLWFTGSVHLIWILAAGVMVWGFGMLGDLFESLLKRRAGVKDSSRILSEHGGMLDRFDSLMFASPPLFYLFSWLS